MKKAILSLFFIFSFFSLSLALVSAVDLFNQFGKSPTFTQEKFSGGSDFANGINISNVPYGIWSETNNNLVQVQPVNFQGTDGYYFAFVDGTTLRVYDSSLTSKATIAVTGTPIPQILVDSQGYIVVASYNSTNVIISRYTFDGSSLTLYAQNDTIPFSGTYIPTGLTFDYGNIVFLFDNPLQLGFVDLDTLYFNYTLSTNSNITRYTDGVNVNYGVTPLNSFDYNNDGTRDYLVFNDSSIRVFSSNGALQFNKNKSSPTPTNHVPRITDVKYISVNNEIVVAEAVSPKTSVPTAQGWFNITAFNASDASQVIWSTKYNVPYTGSNLQYPQNIQMVLTDINFDSTVDSISFILQAGDLDSFQREYNYLGILDLTGNDILSPLSYNFNVSTSNKNYVPRNILTSGWIDQPGTAYETIDRNFVWSSGGKLLVYSIGQGQLIIGNTTGLSGLTISTSTLRYSSCVPMNLFDSSDISIVCSSNQSTYLVTSKSLFVPNSPSAGSGSSGSTSSVNGLVDNINNIFPDYTTLTQKQRITWALLIMLVVAILILAFFFAGQKEIGPLALYFVFFAELLLFVYFITIKYISIGVLITIVVLIGGIALLLRRK